MITRIHKIKNLGSLQHFQSPAGDDYEFQKKTVIYADNAVGKTTLSSVFKSYATDDSVALTARETLGQDEPLSSFDTDRHESTAWLLTKLSKECRQLIVLTHRRDFAGHLHAQPRFDGKFFKLKSTEANRTTLALYDVKADQQHAHDKHINYLVQVADGGSVDDEKVPSFIRKVFEHVLRAKYKRHLSVSEFGRIVSQLKEKNLCEVMDEVERLNVQTRERCHAESKDLPAMSDAEWRTFAGSALETLDKV